MYNNCFEFSLYEKILFQAKKCDNFKFISYIPKNFTSFQNNNSNDDLYYDKETDMKENYIYNILQPPGLNETLNEYDKLTDKIFLTFKYLYSKYNNYDWYLKADDDTWIFVDNLRNFLSEKNEKSPVTFGYNFKVLVESGYHSGGGGYVLSNEAFNRLGYALNHNYSYCKNTGIEDVDVAACLRRLKVYKKSSLDELGRERFHPFNIHASYLIIYSFLFI